MMFAAPGGVAAAGGFAVPQGMQVVMGMHAPPYSSHAMQPHGGAMPMHLQQQFYDQQHQVVFAVPQGDGTVQLVASQPRDGMWQSGAMMMMTAPRSM